MPEPRDPVQEGFDRLRRRRECEPEGATPPGFVERLVDGNLDESERPAAAKALLFDRAARDRALDFLAADLELERAAGRGAAASREADGAIGGSANLASGTSGLGAAERSPSTRRLAWPWLATVAAAALVLVVVRSWFGGPSGEDPTPDLRGYLVAVVGDVTPPKSGGAGTVLRATLRVRRSETLRLATPEGRSLAAERYAAVALRLDRVEALHRRPLSAEGTVAIAELATSGPGIYLIVFGSRDAANQEKGLREAAVGPQEVLARGEGMAAAQGALEAALASEQGATDALYVLVEVVP